jgi:hypothetical protein
MPVHGRKERLRTTMPAMDKRLLWLGLAACACAQAADLVDIVWSNQRRFERQLGIAPGQFAEVCGRLNRGDTVSWRFEADQPLAFNIHYHAGNAVEYPAREEAARSAHGTLAVELDQDYCWMWASKSGVPARVKLSMTR